MASDQWYYAHGGERIGPVPLDALKAMVSAGTLKPQDFVWHETMTDWAPAASVAQLAAQPVQVGQPAPAFAAPLGYAGAAPVNYYSPPQQPPVYAGFWMRFVAYIIDTILTTIVGAILGFAVGFGVGMVMARSGSTSAQIQATAGMLGQILGIILVWLYNAIMESSSTQGSLGKMALGIKVTDLYGQRISFGRASGRHFGQIVSGLILGIGFMMAGFTPKKQALHDSMANCLVVRK